MNEVDRFFAFLRWTVSSLLTTTKSFFFVFRIRSRIRSSSSVSGLSKLVTRMNASASGKNFSVVTVFSRIGDPKPGVSTKKSPLRRISTGSSISA